MNNHSFPIILLASVIIIGCLTSQFHAQDKSGMSYTLKRYDFTLRMRDGILIDCAKFIPQGRKPAKGWPVVLFCHGFS